MKIVFVEEKAEHSVLNLFCETVAVNRRVFGRVFPTPEEAAAWLKSQPNQELKATDDPRLSSIDSRRLRRRDIAASKL